MSEAASDPMLSARDLSIAVEGTRLFEGLDLELQQGEKLLLSGDSGSGKSSFLNAVLGFQRIDKGELELFGHSTQDEGAWQVRERTAYIPQEYELKLESVRELFFFPFTFKRNRERRPSEERALEGLERMGLEKGVMERSPDEVSGGEKQRIIAASLFLLDKPLYIMDEPSSSLDPTATEKLIDAFLEERDRSVIVVAHDPQWRERVDRILELPSCELH